MRTFILRARKGSVRPGKILSRVGADQHSEIIAHTLANALYYSNGMRADVEVYIVLDSTSDFPRTLKFSSNGGLSFPGFHEQAILEVVASALSQGSNIQKGANQEIAPGIEIFGYGFDTLIKNLQVTSQAYLLDPKGEDIREAPLEENCIFLLSDHLSMPKNSIKGIERRGLKRLSLGPTTLFASQCIVLVHDELDRRVRRDRPIPDPLHFAE